MIVHTIFPGDSLKVAWAQHDVYYQALDILVKNCNRLALFARRIVQSESCQNWGSVYQFDHRTLQNQHDQLATVWRYETQASQLRVDCDEDVQSIQQRWLDWLTAEVQSWIERPEWVQLVQIILENQNTPIGYKTETMLSLEIMNYFTEVPWKIELKQAFISELEKQK
jgi:hypothetical protein